MPYVPGLSPLNKQAHPNFAELLLQALTGALGHFLAGFGAGEAIEAEVSAKVKSAASFMTVVLQCFWVLVGCESSGFSLENQGRLRSARSVFILFCNTRVAIRKHLLVRRHRCLV